MSLNSFQKFLEIFPPEQESHALVEVSKLVQAIESEYGIAVPRDLISLWEEVGSGYFGKKEIYVFGTVEGMARESFLEWNNKDFWRDVYPLPKDGAPLFFAETCFGDQIGFRWDGENCVIVLFAVDTFEAFVLANSIEDLFLNVLSNRYALVDEQRLNGVWKSLGDLPDGMHYAPIISPMLGGTGELSNFAVETPNVHLRTAVATFKAVQSVPPGTKLSDIKVEWS
jgi:hypothetical protein